MTVGSAGRLSSDAAVSKRPDKGTDGTWSWIALLSVRAKEL
jgi:hypothetical protein